MSQLRPNLTELLENALPVALRHIPLRIRDVARQLGLRAALVGGIPRDLLRVEAGHITREQYFAQARDFDVVVEGDAVAFSYELVRRLPGKLTLNQAFGTASIATSDPTVIDVASARTEHYPSPGLLPVVELGATIETDLLRRDFTINSLALELGDNFGELIDVTGGAADMRARLVRTLHAASFYEDPTRLFRALRYAPRLNCDFEPLTLEQFNAAVEGGNIDCLTPERVRHELQLVAQEPLWPDIWQAMHFSGLLYAVHPALVDVYTGWLPSDARALENALRARGDLLEADGVEPWLVRTAWALGGVEDDRLGDVGTRIGLYARHAQWIAQARELLRSADDANLPLLPTSLACALVERFPRQTVLVAMFTFQPRTDTEVDLRRALLHYLEEWSRVRSELSGDELIAMGLDPGPQLGELHSKLRYLRLDGIITSVDEEREYARQYIAALNEDEQ